MERNDLIKVIDPQDVYFNQFGHIRDVSVSGGGTWFLVEFDGVNGMPTYGKHQIQALAREDRPEMLREAGYDPQSQAIELVRAMFYGDVNLGPGDVYVVWYCYILGNCMGLLSTNVKDYRYYEVTYNKSDDEFYVDCYVKSVNIVVKNDNGKFEVTSSHII